MPRVRWRLGIITSLFKSKDDHIRGCRLRVSDKGRISEIQRPVNHLFYFEVSSPPTTENSEILTLPADDIKSPPAGRKRRNAFVIGEIKRKFCTS